jgi:myosin heavy subunit
LGTIVHAEGTEVSIRDEAGHVHTHTQSEVAAMPAVQAGQHAIGSRHHHISTAADLLCTSDLSEPSILHTLRQRWRHHAIYTDISDTLISINPYRTDAKLCRQSMYMHMCNLISININGMRVMLQYCD